jgi:hypothetical protein
MVPAVRSFNRTRPGPAPRPVGAKGSLDGVLAMLAWSGPGVWKTILGAVLALAAVVGIAFWSGAVALSRGGPEPAEAPDDDDEDDDRDDDDDSVGDELRSLGYVGATPIRDEDAGKTGVVLHEAEETSPGLNLVIPNGWGREVRKLGLQHPYREVRLMDMDGEVLHRWRRDASKEGTRGWAAAKIGPDGDLYVIHARTALLRVEWDSDLAWRRPEFFHHDLDFLPDGTIVALVEEKRTVEYGEDRIEILDNGFAFVSPDGELKRILWFWDVLGDATWVQSRLKGKIAAYRRKRSAGPWVRVPATAELGHKGRLGGFDVFHANTVEVLHEGSPGRWEKGDLLTSFRSLDTVAVLDAETGALKWHWGLGQLDNPHDPSLLDNGHLLVFDNGRRRKRSRVIEVDLEGRVVWKYDGTPSDPLFSDIRGQAQVLEGGNVLVVDSQTGRLQEVTRAGKVVWEYFNTDVIGDHRIPLRAQRLQGADRARALKSLDPDD